MSKRLSLALALAFTLSACGNKSNAPDAGKGAAPAPAEEEQVDIFELAIGDCLTDSIQGDVSESTKVDCAAPHLSEVYHKFNLPNGGQLPASDALQAATEKGCEPAFATFMGVPYADSDYVYSFLQPTPESWAEGDREIVCLITTEDDSQITGSLRNAKK